MTAALATLGFITVVSMIALIMAKRLSPTVALLIIPMITGTVASFFIVTDPENAPGVVDFWTNFQRLGDYVTGSGGLGAVAGTGVMFIFSILFFGVLTDAGTFRPIIFGITRLMGNDPVKICMGTSLLAMIVHLDGSGAVTFLICIPPLVPLYDALGMRRTTLATCVGLSAGVMNIMPWGGPTMRAATAFNMDVMELFMPVFPAVIAGLGCVLIVDVLLGRKEKQRVGDVHAVNLHYGWVELTKEEQELLRPNLFWVNLMLIAAAIIVLLFSGFPPAVVFMFFYVLATLINFPRVKDTAARVDAHAKSALMMCSVLFAAGCFTGIMKGTGMITEMATALTSVIPASMGRLFPAIVGVISMPASLLFDPDSFYYGVLPVLGQTASVFGVEAADVGRAAILGQMTTGFPVSPLTPSTFLLLGLAGVDLGEHQKCTIPWAFLITAVMLVFSVLIGSVAI